MAPIFEGDFWLTYARRLGERKGTCEIGAMSTEQEQTVASEELWRGEKKESGRGATLKERFVPRSGVSVARVLIVDHYDSFTYNLVQLCLQLDAEVEVLRSDECSVERAQGLQATHWILSPGPGHPADAGHRPELWACALQGRTPPVLGVCLGHQGLCHAMGASIDRSEKILHGKRSRIWHRGEGLFEGCAASFWAVRYHSLVVNPLRLPAQLEATAWSLACDGARGELMAVRHRHHPLFGLQFHPESVGSECGMQLLGNFLAYPSSRGSTGNLR